MNISKGVIERAAKRVVIYGPEGIGKSTFASRFPEPVFIDTEGSTKELDVMRFDADFSEWDTILDAAREAVKSGGMKTLVVDTLDWAEQACIRKLNREHRTSNILTLDYGKGSLYVVAEFDKLLAELNKLVAEGINVVLVAHAAMRKQELPDEMGAFDRWELKLQSKQVKSNVKEWGDMVLFANYRTMVIEDAKTKSKKAQGGKRVMYTQHRPTWDAKNRYGLEECVAFDYDEIRAIIEGRGGARQPEPVRRSPQESEQSEQSEKSTQEEKADGKQERPEIAELKRLMERDGLSEDRVLYACMKRASGSGDFTSTTLDGLPEVFVKESLIKKWDKFKPYAMRFTDAEVEAMEFPFET